MSTCMYKHWFWTHHFLSSLMYINAFAFPFSEQTGSCLLQNPVFYYMRLQLIQGPSVCTYNLNHSFQCALYCTCQSPISSPVVLPVYLVLLFPSGACHIPSEFAHKLSWGSSIFYKFSTFWWTLSKGEFLHSSSAKVAGLELPPVLPHCSLSQGCTPLPHEASKSKAEFPS